MHLSYLCRMLGTRDVQRFMCRAGIQVGTDASMQKVQQAFAEFVRDVQKAAIASMEADRRLTVYAKDIATALSVHPSRIQLYGFDDIVEGEDSIHDSEDENDASDQDDDDICESSDDECSDDEGAVDGEEYFDDSAYGEGEFSDADDSGAHDAEYADEDAMWDTSDDGFVRLDDAQMQVALSREIATPYVVSRNVLLQMWMALTTLPITRPALSALHSAVEHFIGRELVDGKLGSQLLYTVMERLVVQQTDETERLEAEVAECRAALAQSTKKRGRGGGLRQGSGQHNENIPPSSPPVGTNKSAKVVLSMDLDSTTPSKKHRFMNVAM
ncbi:hypothetical protein DYB38_008869 [Aphanomyces astaci]|uniref:Uncharacterized protein n=1 Tax=Aphanomyces astaci TaxID=112090 RepID=A0A397CCI6_APHAT|nr:hypothetical protein DYB38_008869 [Aphanomyces astaci]